MTTQGFNPAADESAAPTLGGTLGRAARLAISLVSTLVCASGAGMVLGGVHSAARPWLVVAGLVLGTGWAVVGWLKLSYEPAFIATLVLGVGFAVPIAVSILLVASGWWHPVGASGAALVAASGLSLLLTVRAALSSATPHRGGDVQ